MMMMMMMMMMTMSRPVGIMLFKEKS